MKSGKKANSRLPVARSVCRDRLTICAAHHENAILVSRSNSLQHHWRDATRRADCMAGTSHQPIKILIKFFNQGKSQMNKSILLAVIVAAGLAACGKQEPAPAPKVEAPKVEAPKVDAAVDAAKAAAGAAVEASKDAAGKTVEAAKDAAGKTVEAAKDAAGKTVEAAKDAAKPAPADAAKK